MANSQSSEVGLLAAQRLARFGGIEIQDGLTEAEIDRVEKHFGFEFADDHHAFLAVGLPVWAVGFDDDPDRASWGWPNWRHVDSETLRRQVNWPVDCIHRYVANGHWPTGWGKRPKSEELLQAKTQRLLADVPRLVLVYAHRYLPAGSGTGGHPVLSVHSLADTIVYGGNLEDYVVREFSEATVTVAFWRDCP